MSPRSSVFALLYVGVSVASGCGGKTHDVVSNPSRGGSHANGGNTATGGAVSLGGKSGGGAIAGDTSFAGLDDLGGTPGSSGASTSGGTDSHGHGGAGASGTGSGKNQGGTTSNGEGGAPAHGEAGVGPSGGAGAGDTTPGVCGDGIVDPNEACDDGNVAPGDGCSANCAVEHGFVCSSAKCADGHCTLSIPATFRDFNANQVAGGHPDFQPGYSSPGAVQGCVEPELDSDGKPVLSSSASVSNGFFHGAAAFAEWYRDDPPSGGPIPGEIVLWDDGSGQGRYVNRFGAHGEQWQGATTQQSYGTITEGLPVAGSGCSDPVNYPGLGCTPGANEQCYDPCVPFNSTEESCCAAMPDLGHDGTPLFFPIDTGPNLLSEPRSEGKIPSQYGWFGYPWESDVASVIGVTTPEQTAWAPFPSKAHNFSFTTEVNYWFRYDAARTYKFEINGDDDVWFFINGHLVIDLGGWHIPLDGSATLASGTLSATAALTEDDDGTPKTVANSTLSVDALGLEDGQVYPLAIFSAEREIESSTFKFAISGIDATRSTCAPAPR